MSRMPLPLRPTYEKRREQCEDKKEQNHEIHIDDEHPGKRAV
jgi:hypothetical protein